MTALFGGTMTALNGATWVTVVSAPGAAKQRQVLNLNVDNRDTADHTIKTRKNKGAGATIVNYPDIVVTTGLRGKVPFDSIVLSATDEVIEMSSNSTASTTEPIVDPAFFEVP